MVLFWLHVSAGIEKGFSVSHMRLTTLGVTFLAVLRWRVLALQIPNGWNLSENFTNSSHVSYLHWRVSSPNVNHGLHFKCDTCVTCVTFVG
jgi:hypothetical protein